MTGSGFINLGSRYQLLQELGRGSFGVVCKGIDLLTHEPVAIKLLSRGHQTKYVEAEFVNHSKLAGHAHVVNFKEVFTTEEHLCLVMEFAEGGTLLQYINRRGCLPEFLARRFLQQLFLALDYCHRKKIAVRDIKLENVLLQTPPSMAPENVDDCWLLKLCDFGYSKSEDKSAMKSKVGTLVYMAPEILTNGKKEGYDGKAGDIWSCGIMLYIMLCGRYPFEAPVDAFADQQQVLHLVEKMRNREFKVPAGLHLSRACRDFMMALLQPDPHQRLTMSQIFQHPWFAVDLPPAFLTYNDEVIEKSSIYRSQVQSPEEIQEVLRQALHNPYQEKLRGSHRG